MFFEKYSPRGPENNLKTARLRFVETIKLKSYQPCLYSLRKTKLFLISLILFEHWRPQTFFLEGGGRGATTFCRKTYYFSQKKSKKHYFWPDRGGKARAPLAPPSVRPCFFTRLFYYSVPQQINYFFRNSEILEIRQYSFVYIN